MQSSKPKKPHKFAVAIPTRNRVELLRGLLENLNSVNSIPNVVFIVDSSDVKSEFYFENYKFPVRYVFTNLNSAARQRNIALDLVSEQKEVVDLISFLDDDVRVGSDYFDRVASVFDSHPECIGVSGIAEVRQSGVRSDNGFRRLIGLSGEPCKITKSVINVPARIGSGLVDADWLIGCSTWNLGMIDPSIRFEEDFKGQSIFEDVIFSWRCGQKGKLICSSEIHLTHLFSSIERPGEVDFYKSWVKNRYRFFKYDKEKTKVWFWLLNIFLIIEALIGSVFRGKRGLKKAYGIVAGSLNVLQGAKS